MSQSFLRLLWCVFAVVCCGALAESLAAAEGAWLLRASNNEIAASDARHPAAQKLASRALAGRPAVALAFTPNDDWIALSGGTEAWTSATGLPAWRKLRQLQEDSTVRELHAVAFTPTGGWVILYDKVRFAADAVPESVVRKLKELAEAGTELRSIVFAPSGGWVILGGAGDVWHEAIPEAAGKALAALAGKSVAGVAFTSGGDWFILTDGAGVHTNRPEHPAAKKLAEIRGGRWLAFSPGDSLAGYRIATAPGRRVKAVLEAKIALPSADVDEWQVYAPQAPTFGGQRDVLTTLMPDGRVVPEVGPLKRNLLASRVKAKGNELRPALTIAATLVARRLLPRVPGTAPPEVKDLTATEAKLYLRSTPAIDLTARPFADWLDRNDLRLGKAEDDVAYARRVYSFIKHHFDYDPKPERDLRSAAVCRAGKGDCGGLSAVFVAALRASGVPARLLQGRWAESTRAGDVRGGVAYRQWHVKAEFFARGVGWVPVDMASAIEDAQRGEFACFGNDPGDFITMHLDHDVVVPTAAGGKQTLFGMQGLLYRWRGKGSTDGERFDETWTVQTVEP